MFDESKITYTLTACEDSLPVCGNACNSGDEDFDREVEKRIFERLDKGDFWAWALVEVVAHYPGFNFVGVDYLGACSYENEEDFRNSGYFYDMKDRAKSDLLTIMEHQLKFLKNEVL